MSLFQERYYSQRRTLTEFSLKITNFQDFANLRNKLEPKTKNNHVFYYLLNTSSGILLCSYKTFLIFRKAVCSTSRQQRKSLLVILKF